MSMETHSIPPVTQTTWKQVAVQKYERMQSAAEGEPVKELIKTVSPTLYISKNGKVEIQITGSTQTISLLA